MNGTAIPRIVFSATHYTPIELKRLTLSVLAAGIKWILVQIKCNITECFTLPRSPHIHSRTHLYLPLLTIVKRAGCKQQRQQQITTVYDDWIIMIMNPKRSPLLGRLFSRGALNCCRRCCCCCFALCGDLLLLDNFIKMHLIRDVVYACDQRRLFMFCQIFGGQAIINIIR